MNVKINFQLSKFFIYFNINNIITDFSFFNENKEILVKIIFIDLSLKRWLRFNMLNHKKTLVCYIVNYINTSIKKLKNFQSDNNKNQNLSKKKNLLYAKKYRKQ